MKNKRVLMIAGGTGGHIFPALAVARALRREGFDLQWLGSRVGMESQLVGSEFPLSTISIKAIRGKGLVTKLLSPVRLLQATWQAWRTIKKLNPDVVVGMGGFVSGPGGVAARLSRKPLIIHEQNAVAGMTNRLLAKSASAVLAGFPNAFPKNIHANTIGNPVRLAISHIAKPSERLKNREGALRVLVLGGSQGARAINEMLPRVFADYPNKEVLSLWHQTGRLDFEKVQKAYCSMGAQVTVEAFIDDIAEAYAWADLVICRAGALTVSEVAAAGLPSILVPFPYAVDDHQFYNGAYLSNAGAAELIRQNDLTDDVLTSLLQKYEKNRPLLIDMAEKARTLARPDALSAIVKLCEKLANGQNK
ncbi:MAG: undecaprenyldiphospho-muramoylpentapeptide beta-N-acetylglucosaminyltransferase [Coxiellaceae bacterium]|nr:undecaprenyldiphospho-muramoylpentapeptide beta-N-acetylglucosaminyltransferase [Coxiellaceae bacterium]